MVVSAYLLIVSKFGKSNEVYNKIVSFEEVRFISKVYGKYDLIANVEVSNLKELDNFMRVYIETIDDIDKMEVLISSDEE